MRLLDTRDDSQRSIEELENNGAELLVHIGFILTNLVIIYLIFLFFYPFWKYRLISGKTVFIFVTPISIYLLALLDGAECTIRLQFNYVCFLFNTLTGSTRVVVGSRRPTRLKLWWEKPQNINLNYNHIANNDVTDPYPTLEGDVVRIQGFINAGPDPWNLTQYNKWENDQIDKKLKALYSNFLKAYVQTRPTQRILPTQEEIERGENPLKRAFDLFDWIPFELEHGVLIKDQYVDSVDLPQNLIDAANMVKVATKFDDTIKILEPRLGADAAARAATILWKQSGEVDLVNIVGLGQAGQGGKKKGKR